MRDSAVPPRILLVEDNAAHANLLLARFERRGMANQIARVKDGVEALESLFGSADTAVTADEIPAPPDVLLLDLRLPKIDGLEVLARVRSSKRLSSLPVVILTTSEAESDLADAERNRADSYLVKPVDIEELCLVFEDLGIPMCGAGRAR